MRYNFQKLYCCINGVKIGEMNFFSMVFRNVLRKNIQRNNIKFKFTLLPETNAAI